MEIIQKTIQKTKQQTDVNIDTEKETDSYTTLLTYAERVKRPTEQVADLSQIYSDLLAGENRFSKIDRSLPNLYTNSTHISNDSGSLNGKRNKPLLCAQDKQILSILEELEEVQSKSKLTAIEYHVIFVLVLSLIYAEKSYPSIPQEAGLRALEEVLYKK